jgi:hypothetical protein
VRWWCLRGVWGATDAFDETYARICHGKRLPEGINSLAQAIALNAQFEMAYFYNQTQVASALG